MDTNDTKTRDAVAREPILQFFQWGHLPYPLQQVSKPFCELALSLETNLPRNPERTVALRKLLEAKDAAVRAVIYNVQRAPEATDPPIAPPAKEAT